MLEVPGCAGAAGNTFPAPQAGRDGLTHCTELLCWKSSAPSTEGWKTALSSWLNILTRAFHLTCVRWCDLTHPRWHDLSRHLHSFAPLQVQIEIFKILPWRKRCLGFGVASKLSDVSSAGAESRWGGDLVGVHHASCEGQRFQQENFKGLSWSSH